MAGSNGSTASTGYFNERGEWVTTQYDHSGATPNVSPARGEGGLGSTSESDVNYALGQNKQAPIQPKEKPFLPNYESNLEEARKLALAAQGWKPTATAGVAGPSAISKAETDPMRAQQYAQLARFADQANGGGPSAAAPLTREAMDAAMRAQMGARATGGLGMRAAIGANAMGGGGAAMQGAAMRAGEQQSAWGALNSAAYGVRGSDIGAATDQAKLDQQIAMANAGMGQSVSLGNQQASLAGLGNQIASAQQYGDVVNQGVGAKLDWKKYELDGAQLARERAQQSKSDDDKQAAQYASWLAMIAMVASDERVKTDVKPADASLREMFETLGAHEYRYKDDKATGAAPGRHISPMAQEIEKTELGRDAVSNAPEGHKMVDYGRLAATQLAATAWLHKRLDKLEKNAGK